MAAIKSCDFIFICLKNIYKSTYILWLKLHFYYALYHLNSILTVSLICSPINEDAEPLLMDMVRKSVDIKSATASPACTSLYFLLMECN